VRSKQAQLKILVIVSFVLILIVWLWNVSRGGLVESGEKTDGWWQELGWGYKYISSDLDQIKYYFNFYKQTVQAQPERSDSIKTEIVDILKKKIENQSSPTSTTSTIDKVNNAKEEKTGEQ